MFKDPYETTIVGRFPINKAITGIQLAKINKQLLSEELKLPAKLYAVGPDNTSIPQFKHPIFIEDYVVIDARTMIKRSESIGKYLVRDKTKLDFDVVRAMLGLLAKQKGNTAIGYDPFGMTVFRTWITDTIVRAKGLTVTDTANQLRLMIIVSFYYHTLYNYDTNSAQYSSTEIEGIARIITNNMGNPRLYDETLNLLKELAPMHNINDLCTNIADHCGVRLVGFNAAMLYTYVGGAWFGDREIVAVALESIPTFLTMLYYSIDSRFYHKTGIGKVAQETNRRGMGTTYIAAMDKLPVFIQS